jgi:uncharacterized protein YbjT (DUF2867 family)
VTVRAAGRTPIAKRAGVETLRFDWADESTFEAACTGVDAMYLVPGPIPGPQHAGYIRVLLNGAAAAGVKRVVLLSVYGLDQAPSDNPLRQIELAVEKSGLPYTLLRPGAFMQNFSEGLRWDEAFADGIRERDEIVGPGGEGVVSYVSSEDIAAVATIALTENGHAGKAYAPLGPEPLTMAQVAAHISWAAGRPIRYVETDHTPTRDKLLAMGAPPDVAEHNSRLHAFAFTSGAFGGLSDDILKVAGRPPVSFGEFAVGAAGWWRR